MIGLIIISLFLCIYLPLVVGYISGRNDVDPDSEFGRVYYNSENYDRYHKESDNGNYC